jgi:Tol biopolymer transport system component
MNASERFDRDLGELMADLVQPRFPDYFDEALERAVADRQRPAWTFPERWFPMGVLSRRRPLVPALPAPVVGVLVILMLLVAVTVAIGVGSLLLQPRPAPAFGLAANGLFAYSQDGDVYTTDPGTGETRSIVSGPTVDISPLFSNDGTKIVFIRIFETGPQDIIAVMMVDADGSNLRTLVEPEVAGERHWSYLSPDGRRLAIVNSADGVPPLSIVDIATNVRTTIDLQIAATEFEWTNDSQGLIIRGEDESNRSALYHVDADGTNLSQLTEPASGEGRFAPPFPISHDGRYLGYSSFSGGSLFLHVLDLESAEVTDWYPLEGVATGWPAFSPDSDRIAFINYSLPTSAEITAQAMVGPIDGGPAAARPVGPAVRIPQLTRGLTVKFSPDGASLMITADSGEVWLVNLASGTFEPLDIQRDEFEISWQRRAP